MPPWLFDLLQGMMVIMSQFGGFSVPTDLVQDLLGAHALLHGGDAYPRLNGVAATSLMGTTADANWFHRSTHPPTAFLFLLPLANLAWGPASQVWALAMLVCLIGTGLAFRIPWYLMVLLLPLGAWPPVLWAFVGLTPVWLLGLAFAWRWRERPWIAGACIGVASLPKFTAAVALGPYLRRGQWHALVSFGCVWCVAIATIVMLNASVLLQYVAVDWLDGESGQQAARADNGAILAVAARVGGAPALLLTVLAIGAVLVTAMRSGQEELEWSAWTWLGIALLPIAWTYSLLPLLPGLLRRLQSGPLAALVALVALAAPFLAPTPARDPVPVAFCVLGAGVAIVAAGLPRRKVHTTTTPQPTAITRTSGTQTW